MVWSVGLQPMRRLARRLPAGLRACEQRRHYLGERPEPEVLAKMDSYYDSTVESVRSCLPGDSRAV